MTICTSALRVTATIAVTCVLPDGHAQHSHADGRDNPQPSRHVGTDHSTVYVWSNRDAGVMNTLRNAGFHEQCDRTARKLAVPAAPCRGCGVDLKHLGNPDGLCACPKPAAADPLHCPTCGSPQPSMHPAVSGGGEVTVVCPDEFHEVTP